MCCMNIHLTVNVLTFNTDVIYILPYMIVTQYQNKMLYNMVFFRYKFYGFVDVFQTYTEPI